MCAACYGLGISIDEMHPYMVSALFLEAIASSIFTICGATENNGNDERMKDDEDLLD